jgi:molybdopterin biosynthesis enzyme
LPKLRARLATELHARAGRPYFVLARVQREEEGFVVKPIANQCSALVRTAAEANAIVTVQEKTGEPTAVLRQDEIIDVEVIDWPSVFDSRSSLRESSTNSAHVSLPRHEILAGPLASH